MTFQEYQDLAARTDGTTDPAHQLLNSVFGLNGEAGEVADYVKKFVYHGHPLEYVKLALEAGDILWYVAQLARSIGWTLEEVAVANVHKLMRRYPEGFNAERSNNREEMN